MLSVIEALRPSFESKAPRDRVSIGKTWTVLDYGYFRTATFNPAVEKMKLTNVTTHTLKHTCASLLISLSTPITTVSYILGHVSVSQSQIWIYKHTKGSYAPPVPSWIHTSTALIRLYAVGGSRLD